MPHTSSAVVDLSARRARDSRRVTAVAAAPVTRLPTELLDALLGSWGTPEELGLRPVVRHLQVVSA